LFGSRPARKNVTVCGIFQPETELSELNVSPSKMTLYAWVLLVTGAMSATALAPEAKKDDIVSY